MKIKKKKASHGHEHVHKVSTLDLIKQLIASKLPVTKQSVINPNISLLDDSPGASINHLAIVLDGRVEEIMRAQNRLSALLLSEPTFVEFDPTSDYPQIGDTYENGKFKKSVELGNNEE
jgi:hypothetical protein